MVEDKYVFGDSDLPHFFAVVSKLTELVHGYWQFFITFSSAIAGWLLTVKPQLSYREKAIVTIVYLLGSLINLRALVRTYVFLDEVLKETASSSLKVTFHSEKMHSLITKIANKSTWILSVITYLFCIVIVLYLLYKKPSL